jgi:hypothetical protein
MNPRSWRVLAFVGTSLATVALYKGMVSRSLSPVPLASTVPYAVLEQRSRRLSQPECLRQRKRVAVQIAQDSWSGQLKEEQEGILTHGNVYRPETVPFQMLRILSPSADKVWDAVVTSLIPHLQMPPPEQPTIRA